MISLALSIPKPGSSSEAGEAGAPSEKGAKGAFSAVLASLGQQKAGGDAEVSALPDDAAAAAKIAAAADKAPATAANGIVLPLPAETGKILPDIAALAADGQPAKIENPEDGAEASASGTGTEGEAVAVVALVQPTATAAVSGTPATAEAGPAQAFAAQSSPANAGGTPVAAQVKPEDGKQPQAPSVALHVAPEADADGSAIRADAHPARAFTASAPAEGSAAALKREGGERAEASSTATHVAPEADVHRSTRRHAEGQPVKTREITAEGLLMPRAASAEPAPQAPSTSFAYGLQAENSPAGRPVDSARPALHADALQDLTRVVDRLAAAREALAPTAAALAVKHADFGELSLRFDQQRDGQLAVQLSASDPDAHRAIAAAVSGASVTADSHTGSGQSHAQARGAAAERDGNGGNTANSNNERRDQPQQRHTASQDTPGGNGTRRNGVFA